LAHKNRTIEALTVQIDRLTTHADRLTRLLERKDDDSAVERKAVEAGAKVIMIDHVRRSKRG